MRNKQAWGMCMVGKFVYEGIKAILTRFFEPGMKYDKEYIRKAFDEFYDDTGMRLEFYGDDYDMVTFMRNKIYLISRNDEDNYFLNENGRYFRKLLLSDEKKFKKELFKWVHKHSQKRFRSLFFFVERLKRWLDERGKQIPNSQFQALVDNIVGRHRFNEGVVALLESLGLFTRIPGGYELDGGLFSVISSREEELRNLFRSLKSQSRNNKLSYNAAIGIIREGLKISAKESEGALKELEDNDFIIIRSTRGGKYVEF